MSLLNKIYSFIVSYEAKAYFKIVSNKKIPIHYYIIILIKIPFNIIESLIRNINGPIGIKIRSAYYSLIFKNIGKNAIIDIGVNIINPSSLTIGNNVYIDSYAVISNPQNNIIIGDNVHIGPHSFIGGKGDIVIGDYCGLSSGSRIYSGSAKASKKNILIHNPTMAPNSAEVIHDKVILEKNCVLFANSVVLPGVTMKEGSILSSCSYLSKNTIKNSIYAGTPAIKRAIRNQ